jgi:large subunit ribosomal protein L20
MRVKTGFTRRQHHNKVLSRTKGFRMTKNRLYKVAREADLHAGQYAFAGRKNKKRDLRRLWIQRINAGLEPFDLSYSKFIDCLKKSQIELDRKILAEMVISNPDTFKQLVESVKTNSQAK